MCRYAVVDLEMCNVPRWLRSPKYPYGKETIQIGAVYGEGVIRFYGVVAGGYQSGFLEYE